PCYLAECRFGLGIDLIGAFLEHEYRNLTQPEFTGSDGKLIKLFLHGVPDEHQCLDLGFYGLAAGMHQHPTDLRGPTPAVDPAHELGESVPTGNPGRGAALIKTPVVDKLHLQALRDRPEHLGLELTRLIPRRLSGAGG